LVHSWYLVQLAGGANSPFRIRSSSYFHPVNTQADPDHIID